MKIEETCNGAEPAVVYTRFEDIPIGMVFKHASSKKPFLRLFAGLVDLADNVFYPQQASNRFPGYIPFPAARVVLK